MNHEPITGLTLMLNRDFAKHFFQNWPFSLHAYTVLPLNPDGYRVLCSFKPTQSLHEAYIVNVNVNININGNQGGRWRTCRNRLACLQDASLLTVLKFSREFSANQRANDC